LTVSWSPTSRHTLRTTGQRWKLTSWRHDDSCCSTITHNQRSARARNCVGGRHNGGTVLNAPAPLSVRWLNSESEIPPEFFDLCFRGPVEGRWWYHTMENCSLKDQFTFAYAMILRGQQPIGIAPVFVMDVPLELVAPPEVTKLLELFPVLRKLCPFLVTQRTLFVGSPCANKGTVGLVPGVKLSEVASALQSALNRRAAELGVALITWKDFDEIDATALDELCKTHGLFKVVSRPETLLVLPPGGMNGYFNSLKSSRRHNLRKKLRRSKEQMQLDVEIVQHPAAAVLQELFPLFWQTFARAETKFERLDARFFELIAQSDVSWFILLRDHSTKQLVAFDLVFKLGQTVICKYVGTDYELTENAHLYFRLSEAVLEWAISSGATIVWCGSPAYAAKIDVGYSLVPLSLYCKHRNPVINRIYARLSKAVSWSTLDSQLGAHLKVHPEDDWAALDAHELAARRQLLQHYHTQPEERAATPAL
jgi:uncharacterized protein